MPLPTVSCVDLMANKIVADCFASVGVVNPVLSLHIDWAGGTPVASATATVGLTVVPSTLLMGHRAMIEWAVFRAVMGYTNFVRVEFRG